MNINLLPDKYIKNRAPLVIILVSGILMIIVFVSLILMYSIGIFEKKQIDTQLIQKQGELVLLSKEIGEYKKTQMVDFQARLKEIQENDPLIGNLLIDVNKTVKKNKLEIIEYSLALEDLLKENAQSNGNVVITLKVTGEKLPALGKVMTDLNKKQWVEEASLLSSTLKSELEDDKYESEVTILTSVMKLPKQNKIKDKAEK